MLVDPEVSSTSDKIVATFTSKDGIRHDFRISGRGTSVIGSTQGDHVTAFGLIRRGITRLFDGLYIERADDLEEIRKIRDEKVFAYISAILAIDDEFRDFVVKELALIMDRYNKCRFEKTKLQKVTAIAKKYEMDAEEVRVIAGLIEGSYINNCYHMCNEMSEITRSLLTHFNHVRHSAFPREETVSAPKDEGSIVNQALDYLDGNDRRTAELKFNIERRKKDIEEKKFRLKDLRDEKSTRSEKSKLLREVREAEESIGALQTSLSSHRSINAVVQRIKELFFYPKLDDVTNAKNQQIESDFIAKDSWRRVNGYSQTAEPRTNNQDVLEMLVARHLFIIFAAYPELREDKQDVVDKFVKLVSKEWRISERQLSENVIGQLEYLGRKEENVLERPEISSRRSSDAEESMAAKTVIAEAIRRKADAGRYTKMVLSQKSSDHLSSEHWKSLEQ